MQRSSIGNASSRLDFLGGHSAYAEGLVLQAPIEHKTTVLLTEEAKARLSFTDAEGRKFDASMEAFLESMRSEDRIAACREWLEAIEAPEWTWHCAGALAAFSQRFRWLPNVGLSFAIASRGPDGYRSILSAGMKIAALRALEKLVGHYHSNNELARAAYDVERRLCDGQATLADIIGMASSKPGCIQTVDTRTHALLPHIDLPRGVVLVGWPLVDGSKQAYRARSDATKEAFGWARAQFNSSRLEKALESPSRFELLLASALPESLSLESVGEAFDSKSEPYQPYKDTPDPLPIRSVLRSVARENYRCSLACHLLSSMAHNYKRKAVENVGELLYQSYGDAKEAGLASAASENIVAALAERGEEAGIFGARLCGCRDPEGLIILADRKALPMLRELAAGLGSETGPLPDFVS